MFSEIKCLTDGLTCSFFNWIILLYYLITFSDISINMMLRIVGKTQLLWQARTSLVLKLLSHPLNLSSHFILEWVTYCRRLSPIRFISSLAVFLQSGMIYFSDAISIHIPHRIIYNDKTIIAIYINQVITNIHYKFRSSIFILV